MPVRPHPCFSWSKSWLLYLEDGLGAFLVVRLGFLHSGDEGQLLQVLQDGQSSTLLGQFLAVALALSRKLPYGDAGQEAFHVWGAALLQHLGEHTGRTGWKRGPYVDETSS